jgi:beta-glucosidase
LATFNVSSVKVTPTSLTPSGHATVTAEVTNGGSRGGDEVVQLYVHDLVSWVTRPTKELRGFARVSLQSGEKKTVTFALGPEALSLVNSRMERVVEPGRFDVIIET